MPPRRKKAAGKSADSEVKKDAPATEFLYSPAPKTVEDMDIDPPARGRKSGAVPRKKPARVPEWEGEAGVEEAASSEESAPPKMTRPPAIHVSLYRKIAVTFAVVTGIILILVLYLAFARVTVTIVPRKTEVSTETLVTVRPVAAAGEVQGVYVETALQKTKTLPITGEGRTEDGTSAGTVTLINASAADQQLVATTRLLSDGGVLFRLKKAVRVPAGGRVDAEVYADASGASGDIGPSKFTIPGLNQALQQSIYAESAEPMTGGIRTVKVVTEADVSEAVATVEKELALEGATTLRALAGVAVQGGGEIISHETSKRETSSAVGTEASAVEVTVGLRVRGVFYDQATLNKLASDRLRSANPAGSELASIDTAAFDLSIERVDAAAQTATVKVIAKGTSAVSASSDIFDRDKLAGLSAKGVAAYFNQFSEVESVSVRFRPSWLRRVPNLKDHIDIVIVR